MLTHPGPIPLTVTTTTTTLFCRRDDKRCQALRSVAYVAQHWVEKCSARGEVWKNITFSDGDQSVQAPDWCPLQYTDIAQAIINDRTWDQ